MSAQTGTTKHTIYYDQKIVALSLTQCICSFKELGVNVVAVITEDDPLLNDIE